FGEAIADGLPVVARARQHVQQDDRGRRPARRFVQGRGNHDAVVGLEGDRVRRGALAASAAGESEGERRGDRPVPPHAHARTPSAAASTATYSRTTVARPTNTAREMMAWPIETSSRNGRPRKVTRLARSRSWPALTPRPSECARRAASAYCSNDRRAASAPRSN